MPERSVLLSVNGETSDNVLNSLNTNEFSLCMAVDGGLRHLQTLGLTPDYLIGDLDSVEQSAVAALRAAGVKVMQHPPEKDLTDLELALRFIAGLNIDRVTLLGIDGGRTDHAFANLLLLGKADWTFELQFLSDNGNGYVISPACAFRQSLPIESEVSLLPLTPQVQGWTTSGLYYPLDDYSIALGSTLGISNVVTKSLTTVTVKTGKLLALHTPVY